MKFKHPNLFVMIPYSERDKVADFFDLNVVGEQYANMLGNLTDLLSEYAIKDGDIGENTVIAPILRAGLSMSNRLSKRLPMADVAQISMRRNLKTLKPFVAWDEFNKISDPENKNLFITDPALATGGSILKTIELAKKHGFKDENITIMAMFGDPVGLEKITIEYPYVKIYLAHMADGIREDGYLIPDNGDTGDRLYGVRENEFII
ncbi:uracil phosphoribosyltransferase (plasmid) [Paraclostridium bifermentans]|uniref:Uracil phosphoribosyltransferase n=1 Tax=Paraclostridium bifermentans TaxID=1490 RepID=A0ABY8R7W0_PARBF|nr:uracil phosphoribosyltransferase [Paraclostridium bifermentans]